MKTLLDILGLLPYVIKLRLEKKHLQTKVIQLETSRDLWKEKYINLRNKILEK